MRPCASAVLAVAVALVAGCAPFRPRGNPEVKRLVQEDQQDRRGVIDWQRVDARDRERRARILQLLDADALHTADDYRFAALILQHGEETDDPLLAHELCVIAISLGSKDAIWLAAASEDRFLTRMKRPQRFGTQYVGGPDGHHHLADVDPQVTDGMRRAMNAPSAAQAKAREAEIDALVATTRPPALVSTTAGGAAVSSSAAGFAR